MKMSREECSTDYTDLPRLFLALSFWLLALRREGWLLGEVQAFAAIIFPASMHLFFVLIRDNSWASFFIIWPKAGGNR
jgi:hypothetical protein